MAWHGFGPRENKSGFITITTALPSYHAALAGWMHGWMDADRECCRQVHRWADRWSLYVLLLFLAASADTGGEGGGWWWCSPFFKMMMCSGVHVMDGRTPKKKEKKNNPRFHPAIHRSTIRKMGTHTHTHGGLLLRECRRSGGF